MDLPEVSTDPNVPLPEVDPNSDQVPYRIGRKDPGGEYVYTTGYGPRARPVQPPTGFGGGVGIPDLGPAFAEVFKNLPVEQAGKAIEAATQYIGQRGYMKDLQSGSSAAQAFAKWGPMLFHRNATGIPEAIMRTTSEPMSEYQKAQIAHQQDVANKPSIHSTPGGGLYRVPPTGAPEELIAPTPKLPSSQLTAAQRQGLREANQDLDRATKDATENIKKKFTDPKVLDAASRATAAHNKIDRILGTTPTLSATPFKEGDTIRSKKDGKLYKVVNGNPIPESP